MASPVFATTDPAVIEAELVADYEAAAGRTLAPADPVRLIIGTLAAWFAQLRALINFTGLMNLLDYATGSYLEALGAFFSVTRLPASAALTTIRFTLSAAQPGVVTIPAGTRVSAGDFIFATIANADVAAGLLTIDVDAQAAVAGETGNGYTPGQINQMVDVLAWLQSASNTTASQGGAEEETDTALRERIRLAPTAFSVGGPIDAYKYWATTASTVSAAIIDVYVSSPNPGEIVIVPLLTDGDVPGAEVLAAVEDACSDETVRPLADDVSAVAPAVVNYDITLTYYINTANSASAVDIQAAVDQAVEDFQAWQRAKLGRDVNPSELIRRVMDAGALKVVLTAPAAATVAADEVAHSDAVTVTYGGLASE